VKAERYAIADDPAFSKTAFVQAKSLKVGVELLPLIFFQSAERHRAHAEPTEINLVRSQAGISGTFLVLGGQSYQRALPRQQRLRRHRAIPDFSVAKLK